MINLRTAFFYIVFVCIIVTALTVRIIAARHGLPYIYNFDEVITSGAALEIMKSGDYNPHTFNYGSFLIYVYFFVDCVDFIRLMGEPESAKSYLTSLQDLHFGFVGSNAEWLWRISHPSFYFWNRMVSVVLSVSTIVFTFLMAKGVTGSRWAALISLAFLSFLDFHIQHSAYTTPDGPAACFVVSCVFFASLFLLQGSRVHFITSLILCGLSAATKYNSGLVIAVPATALFMRYAQHGLDFSYSWFLCIPLIPAATFLIVTPYSFLDVNHFLEDVGEVVRNYRIDGHGDNSSNPGLEQLLFQLSQFYENIGLLTSIIVIIGTLGLISFPSLRIIMLFPFVYILYMSQMKTNFHRNFVQIYPFLAILFAVGARILWISVHRYLSRWPRLARVARICVPLLFVIALGFNGIVSGISAAGSVEDIDTRSKFIAAVNGLGNISRLMVPDDLRIHEQDLKRLRVPYSVGSIGTIAACRQMPEGTAIVLPLSLAEDGESEQQKQDETIYDHLIANAGRRPDVLLQLDGSPLFFNAPTRSPGLLVVRSPQDADCWPGRGP